MLQLNLVVILQIQGVLADILEHDLPLLFYFQQLVSHELLNPIVLGALLGNLDERQLPEIGGHAFERRLSSGVDVHTPILDAARHIASDDESESGVIANNTAGSAYLALLQQRVQLAVSALDLHQPALRVLLHQLAVVPLKAAIRVLLETAIDVLADRHASQLTVQRMTQQRRQTLRERKVNRQRQRQTQQRQLYAFVLRLQFYVQSLRYRVEDSREFRFLILREHLKAQPLDLASGLLLAFLCHEHQLHRRVQTRFFINLHETL